MKFDMVAPCAECPFRSDIDPYLTRVRVRQIIHALVQRDQTFACHKTVEHDDDGDGEETINDHNQQHCAGALIFLEGRNKPNQMMRIAERLRLYDRTKLKMDGETGEMVARQQSR